jgi:hypothetical protein
MKLGISHHFLNKDNNAPARLVDKATGEKNNLWAFGNFVTADLSTEGIQKHVLSGKAISVASCKSNWRKEANFISAQLIGVDFDDHTSVKDCLRDPFIEQYAFLTYATPSSTAEKPRSRVLFALDEPITDVVTYKRLVKRLLWHMKVANGDEQCKDAVRIFYGCKTDDYSAWLDAELPMAILESLPQHPDEAPKPEIKRRELIDITDPQERSRLESYARVVRNNIFAALATTPDGMDIRHRAINTASMRLAGYEKGGWMGFEGWQDEFRSILRGWDRKNQEIEASIKGALIKALPMPLALPAKEFAPQNGAGTTPIQSTNGRPSTLSISWRTSDDSMARYRERLDGAAIDPALTPLPFPLTCLHRKGGFCVAIPPGVLMGIVGMSGGLKTAMLETITDLWRQMDEIDILWWGIEWSWEKMADRAILRLGSPERPTPSVDQMMLHELWLSEEAMGKPVNKRYGKRLHEGIIANGKWASEQIEKWQGKAHYIEQMDVDLDNLLVAQREKVRALRASGRNLRVAVWDYMQLLNLRGIHDESERINQALGRIKSFCIEEKLIGLVASQVTKTSASSAKKGDAVLEAESGQHFRGDKFNLVLTLNPVYRGKMLTQNAIINVSKNSAGQTGKVTTYIDPSRFKWLDSEAEDEEEPEDAESVNEDFDF